MLDKRGYLGKNKGGALQALTGYGTHFHRLVRCSLVGLSNPDQGKFRIELVNKNFDLLYLQN